MTVTVTKEKWQITRDDLVPVAEIGGVFASGCYRFPRDAYRGELRTPGPRGGSYIANVYVLDRKVYIATPREFGSGEIAHMLPGSYEPQEFEAAGGYNVSANSRVNSWRFKEE